MLAFIKLRKILLVLFFLFLPCYFVAGANAQIVEVEECGKYYQFGEVKVNLNTKKTSFFPGEKVELLGTVVNNNNFPLLNLIIFAHLKRINKETFLENGHFLVDRLTLAQNLNFLPWETKKLSLSFEIKDNYPEGQYQLQYFVFSKEGFYYSGRPFLEEDIAGVTNFEIKNTVAAEVFFDIDNLRLGGQWQKIRDYLPIFGPGENPLIEVNLKDARIIKSDFLIAYRWYSWDDSFEENLVKTGRTYLFANQPPIFQTTFDLGRPGAYVLLLEINQPVRSLFKFRIARRGEKAENLRMNDLGITNYPADPQKDRAFVCFHSPSEEDAPQTRVTLSLFEKTGQLLETKSVVGTFSSEVMAISIPLNKLSDRQNFSIEANFENLENPSLSKKIRHEFNCQLFSQSLTNLSPGYQGGRLTLTAFDGCGGLFTNAYAEKLIIYQDGQIVDERYNLEPLPSEIDASYLPEGNYKVLVKSGQIEKEMNFKVEKAKVKKGYWWLVILGMLFLTGLVIFVLLRKKISSPSRK